MAGQDLGGLGTLQRPSSRHNVQPVVDLYAIYSDRDLGSIADGIHKLTQEKKQQDNAGASVGNVGTGGADMAGSR